MEDCEYYIHKSYIGESGWSGQTWDWLMGTIGWSNSATLVDVINSIWNVASNAVTIVKQAATNVMNAVKKGLEWISDSVLGPIIDEFVTGFQLILKTIGYLIDSIIDIPELTISILSDGIQLNDKSFRIYRDNLDAILEINSFKLELNGLFVFPTVTFETLSVGLDSANNVQNWDLLSFVTFLLAHIAGALTQSGNTETWTETNSGVPKFHGSDDIVARGGETVYRRIPASLAASSFSKITILFAVIAIPTIISYLLNAYNAMFSMSRPEGSKFFASMGFFHAFSTISFGASAGFAKYSVKYIEMGLKVFRLPTASPQGSETMAIVGLLVDVFTFGLGALITDFMGFGTPSVLSFGIGGLFAAASLIATAKGHLRVGEGIQQALVQLTFFNLLMTLINTVLWLVRQVI